MKKQCGLCRRKKDRILFYANKNGKDGLSSRCKLCTIKVVTEWRADNRDRRLAWYQALAKNKRKTADRLKNTPCGDCGRRFPPECMDFDHVRGKKSGNVGAMIYGTCSEERLLKEIEKCEVVCSNCHRIRTRKRGKRK